MLKNIYNCVILNLVFKNKGGFLLKYCKKCKSIIHSKEETYHGLCFNCYKEYLYEKIEKMREEPNKPKKKMHFWAFIKNFLKK